MSKYKIGITEAGDAGLDLSWEDKLNRVDATVLITKGVYPDFREAVLRHKDKVIVHATVTGYGETVLEPNVMSLQKSFDAVTALVKEGFPIEQVVIRVDPIIPTTKGITTAKNVIIKFLETGFTRYRVSIIDMYPHVRERFKAANLPLFYGDNGFSPNTKQIQAVNDMLEDFIMAAPPNMRIESCAEPGLTTAIPCGCISEYDLNLFGLSDKDDGYDGFQRKNCLCYSGKTELLSCKGKCKHNCLYCYWK